MKRLGKISLMLALGGWVALFVLPRETAHAFPDNCGLNRSNLLHNGSMAPGHDTPFGFVATEWEPFVFSGTPPIFEWVDNEKWDANGAQYFWADSTPFDAGIYQTVGGLQVGSYYRFRIGYSHARLDPGTVTNDVHPSMGRQVGVDPFGGSDPHLPSVIWGPALFNSGAGMNPDDLTMNFAARTEKATIYFRGIFKGALGRAKVWFDVACMEPLFALPTATPPPPTATAIPAATTRPSPSPSSTRPPVTRVAQISATRVPTPTNAPTATPRATGIPTQPPLRARPELEQAPGFFVDMDQGLLLGVGIGSVGGSLFFFALGFVFLKR